MFDQTNHALIAAKVSSLDEVVVVFGSLKDLSNVRGAAILNADGGLIRILEIPKLLSTEYREFAKKVGEAQALKTLKFINVYTKMNVSEPEKMIVSIGFDYEWFELRVFDPVTGRFGESLGVGRS
jgi:hypothetical protein